jgi:hypothetical protein
MRRSLVISARFDPSVIATLSTYYEGLGIDLGGSYSELLDIIIEEAIRAHGLSPHEIPQDQAITALAQMGYSTKQIDTRRGELRTARREAVEESAASRSPLSTTPSLPSTLQDKIDGIDPSPYTKEDLSIMLSKGLITQEQFDESI